MRISTVLAALCLILVFAVSSRPTFAAPEASPSVAIVNKHEHLFFNSYCERTETCSLERVYFITEDYTVSVDGEKNYGTRLIASYETDKVENLEDYVFVQFIEGCSCLSYYDPVKKKEVYLFRNMTHYGQIVPAYHPQSVIDSLDADPAYASDLVRGRHFFYRWSQKQGKLSFEDKNYHGVRKAPHPELYVVDYPSRAFAARVGMSSEVAYSNSLKFKMCLYRSVDVSQHILAGNTTFAKPIICHEWMSSYVWNRNTKKFDRPASIAPMCAEAKAVISAPRERE